MTGRRLYDLLCDAHAARAPYYRRTVQGHPDNRLGLNEELVAWPHLSHGERRMFTQIAGRLKGVKR